MKKFFTTIILPVMFLVVGCVDLDELWNEIDLLKKQNTEQSNEMKDQKAQFATYQAWLENLKQATSNANSEISSIKGLVDALTNKVSVVSYKELADKSGYELTMSNGTKITLKHGAKGADGKDGKDGADGKDGVDGIAPKISVKLHDDGLFYWTINGKFLLDADGNMIPVKGKDGKDGKDGANCAAGAPGKDGKDGADGIPGVAGAPGEDGITPLLRVNSDLFWEMSLDGGKTWQLLKDANNYTIKAQGPAGYQGPAGPDGTAGADGKKGADGEKGPKGNPGPDGADANINITITETYTEIIITYEGNTYTIPKAPFNPLSLVAKYNVNETGDGFVTSETSCTGSGYFTYNDAVALLGNGKIIDGKQYHIPGYYEWRSIVYYDPLGGSPVDFTDYGYYTYNVFEDITVKGKDITIISDYAIGVSGVTYALRYKGTNMETAWKYEYITDGSDTYMKISSRNVVGMGFIVMDIDDATFWNSNNQNDVIRHFPASGGIYEGALEDTDYGFFFLHPKPDDSWPSYSLGFGSSGCALYHSTDENDKLNVRLFETLN